jgi:hypothetical protein
MMNVRDVSGHPVFPEEFFNLVFGIAQVGKAALN